MFMMASILTAFADRRKRRRYDKICIGAQKGVAFLVECAR